MRVRERSGRSRHGGPLNLGLWGWHAKLSAGLPLVVIPCFVLSVLVLWRLMPPDYPGSSPGDDVPVPVPADNRFILKEDFMSWSSAEFDEMSAQEHRRIILQAEEEELDERSEPYRRNWEELSRNVRRSDKGYLHERDDGELERSAQPLCIYETYSGIDAWPHLHENRPLYRGLGLSSMCRRPGGDDVDASLRLPSLNESYHLDLLCESTGLFAIAHRIDRVHKNDWIGFQPWQAAVRKVALSEKAEGALIERLATGIDGDTVYFWAPAGLGGLPGHQRKYSDFWTLCDALNGGNCRLVFLETFKLMYGLPEDWTELPSMISDSDLWSGMHCWVMPTSSFVELVMFVRMFVDSLDSLYRTAHHDLGICTLGAIEVRHCYCNLLEGLVNVWAFHSARKFMHVHQQTGIMQEVHDIAARQGRMWVKWFELQTLKGMDEDLAQFADRNGTSGDWLWPKTGEVFWQGMMDREKQKLLDEKSERKQKLREKISRMRTRYRQKSVGRYVKAPPGGGDV